ncbi:MAG: prefoldin subunit alpha [Nitrosopumilales archaeon]|jgi:prefoldin alpha subunit|nr:prefoldin subunit alpha [Nitrosopumilales archaeon]MRN61266.1 prefoldin subunit alpha [Nitrosopumilales archaeon]MRN68749.1 prefoldin subunit alpha [Nitrosopumilales archaeon]
MSNEINRQQAGMEQKINEMVEQSRILEAYMNDIINREATVTRLVGEARLASTAIQNIVDENVVEALTPVGIGVYVKTLVPPMKKLLINVGAGVTVEKTREDAINYVEVKIKEFELALRQLLGQKQQIAVRMEQIQAQINQMLQQGQSTPASSLSNPRKQAHDNDIRDSSRQPSHSV